MLVDGHHNICRYEQFVDADDWDRAQIWPTSCELAPCSEIELFFNFYVLQKTHKDWKLIKKINFWGEEDKWKLIFVVKK